MRWQSEAAAGWRNASAAGPPIGLHARLSARVPFGTDPRGRRFPTRDGIWSAVRMLLRRSRGGDARCLHGRRQREYGPLQRERGTGCAERRRSGRSQCLLYLSRPSRAGRRGGNAEACRSRRRLSSSPARGLWRRAAAPRANGVDCPQSLAHRARARVQSLCGDGLRTARVAAQTCPGPLPRWRPAARHPGLRKLPRSSRSRYRIGKSAAGRAACRLPGRAIRAMAPRQAAERSRQHNASHQPASDSLGKRGSRGLRSGTARGSSQSGISGSIPRSTSWRSQK